jgi:hypothetical protein
MHVQLYTLTMSLPTVHQSDSASINITLHSVIRKIITGKIPLVLIVFQRPVTYVGERISTATKQTVRISATSMESFSPICHGLPAV